MYPKMYKCQSPTVQLSVGISRSVEHRMPVSQLDTRERMCVSKAKDTLASALFYFLLLVCSGSVDRFAKNQWQSVEAHRSLFGSERFAFCLSFLRLLVF